MFDCGPPLPGEFMCRFTSNEMFTSGALEVNRHEFEDSQYQNRESHASELTNLLDADISRILNEKPSQQQLPPVPVPVPVPDRNPEPPRAEEPAKNPGRTNLF